MNRKRVATVCAFLITTVSLLWTPGALAATATINPSQDNTVAEELPDTYASMDWLATRFPAAAGCTDWPTNV